MAAELESMPRGPDPKHSDQQILELFRDSPDPVLFATEIAEALDTTRQTVYNRMEDLQSKGYVHTKKPGERTRIYWMSRKGELFLADQSDADSEGSQ